MQHESVSICENSRFSFTPHPLTTNAKKTVLQRVCTARDSRSEMNRWQLLRAVWLVGVACVLPKAERGLRCTKPFCDFTCCTAEAGCTMGDFGGDVDIDANMVRMHHNACTMHAYS